MRRRRPRRGFDVAWKYAARAFFPDLLLLLFPQIHNQIDWTQPVEFLDANLYRLAPSARGKRHQTADIIAKVCFQDGKARIVLIHIEIQAQPDPNFPLRMFVYHYHIFDANDYAEVISLAILADSDPAWRPTSFGYRNAGSQLEFEFSVVKLLDLDEAVLERSGNPFALVVLAHLRALKTRGKPDLMLREKMELIRQLQRRGYTPEQVIHLYKVVDFMMTLSQEMEQQLKQLLRASEEGREWPLTSLEQIALREGAAQGIVETITLILQRRFGDAALELESRLMQVQSPERLKQLSLQAVEASSLQEFTRWLDEAISQQQ